MGSDTTLLSVRGLKTVFRSRSRTVVAVNEVSFDLEKGEVLGVVGESGSGKSVTMMSIMGLERSEAGEVIFKGEDLRTLNKRRLSKLRGNRIGMIFQDPMKSLNPVLSVGRQLGEPLRTHRGMDKKQARARAVQLLGMVGIPDAERRVKDFPHQFSGGMRQRVMMAIAIACEPDLLIADEPTTALDVTVQAQILELVSRMRDELGMAVILVSHDLGVVAGMADRIAVMYAGKIVEIGPVHEVYGAPKHPYTEGLLSSIPRVESERGSDLKAIKGSPPDLTKLPSGCSFRDRCSYAMDICAEQTPPLEQVTSVAIGHKAACWLNHETWAPKSSAHDRITA